LVVSTAAPKVLSIRSAWFQVGCDSVKVEIPGALRAASSNAALVAGALAGSASSTGMAICGPCSLSGSRP
jgi:hypothetical protein